MRSEVEEPVRNPARAILMARSTSGYVPAPSGQVRGFESRTRYLWCKEFMAPEGPSSNG